MPQDQVYAYRFDGYWEDMRSIGAFYNANMESTKKANMGYKSVTLNSKKNKKTVHPIFECCMHDGSPLQVLLKLFLFG